MPSDEEKIRQLRRDLHTAQGDGKRCHRERGEALAEVRKLKQTLEGTRFNLKTATQALNENHAVAKLERQAFEAAMHVQGQFTRLWIYVSVFLGLLCAGLTIALLLQGG